MALGGFPMRSQTKMALNLDHASENPIGAEIPLKSLVALCFLIQPERCSAKKPENHPIVLNFHPL